MTAATPQDPDYASVRSGDLLLCAGWTVPAALVRLGTHSEWTHAAIAVWLATDEGRRLFLFEASRVADQPCALRAGALAEGCRLVQADRVLPSYARVACRPVACARGPALHARLSAFMRRNVGKGFPSSLLRIVLVNTNLAARRQHDDGAILCSELCSEWLELSGAVSPPFFVSQPHHLCTPRAFASDERFPASAFAGPLALLKDDGMDGTVRTAVAAIWACSLFLYILLSVEDDQAYARGERRAGTRALARRRRERAAE